MKPTIKPTISIILAVAVLSLTTAVVSGDDDEPIMAYTGTEEVQTQSVGDDAGDTACEDSTDDDTVPSVPSESELTEDSAAYSSGVQSGRCGENVTWTLEGGVLTISGEGDMDIRTEDRADDIWYPKEDVQSVIVEPGITSIDDNAFNGCKHLISVSLPDTITLIENKAFYGCINLQSIIIPESVTTIRNEAFRKCTKLKTIYIPANVSQIAYNPFMDCDELGEINVDENNPVYCSIDGVLFSHYDHDYLSLICYPDGKSEAHYSIPDGVVSIASVAFYNNENISSLNIPEGVGIYQDAFWSCDKLAAVSVPKTILSQRGYVFNAEGYVYRNRITHVHIPMNTNIDDYLGKGNLPDDRSFYHVVNEYGCCEDENCPLNINRELKLEISPHSENDMWEKDFEYTNDTDGYVTNFGVSFRNGGQLADYAAMYIVYPDGTVELAEIHDGKIDQANSDMLLPALLEEQPGDIQAAKRAYRNIAPGQKVYGYLSTDDVDLF